MQTSPVPDGAVLHKHNNNNTNNNNNNSNSNSDGDSDNNNNNNNTIRSDNASSLRRTALSGTGQAR